MSIAGFSYWQIVLGGLGATFAICANMVAIAMVGKINEKVPEAQRESYVWWNADILPKYRRLYPLGRLAYLYKACIFGMAICFAAVAVTLASRGDR